MRPRRGYPVCIRGVDYPSMIAAARALQSTCLTIDKALDEGWIDEVGLPHRRGGAPFKPIRYHGKLYPSITAAAAAHGVSKPAVSASKYRSNP